MENIHPALRRQGEALHARHHERPRPDGSGMARSVPERMHRVHDRLHCDPHLRLGDERRVLQELHFGRRHQVQEASLGDRGTLVSTSFLVRMRR